MSHLNRVELQPDIDKLYELYRERISHEDLLINQRTIWFVTLQAFLFTSISLLAGEFTGYQFEFLVTCYGLIGMIVSGTTFLSVRAAQDANDTIKELWKKLASDFGPTYHPPIAGGGQGVGICQRGSLSSVVLPVAIGFVWMLVISTVWVVENPPTEYIVTTTDIAPPPSPDVQLPGPFIIDEVPFGE
ncbi:MAG: hypothetical protein AAFN94_11070 [Pseudomonadota bacterium]